ncbi:DUF969 domain-containing protein [Thermoflavimicrobium dichotomicum]|uniref:Uncharacterized membrane protein n=1 Tax=Thermoflavimicrobium dichotomicum TaxID=46223 RepID=A0A1I3L428_9BACL|nr:DUF969 domain-containing protein [Thermoflavimicrobium dichotomicum]SFI79482.1 Uncharacterized membrane protein [Thermoflavimicrobium dichotomicum]
MFTLIGILIVIIGFALRFNPLLVVTVAGVVTGIAAGLSVEKILTTFGEAFVKNRTLSIVFLTLPIIGILERHGLKEQAQKLISKIKTATTGRLLVIYLFIRELTAALGLTSMFGHAQTVRPLVAPMAEGASQNKYGKLPQSLRDKIKSYSAATDNVGLFFGEDIFIAFGAVLLMVGFFAQHGMQIEPLHIAIWGIPTAIAAFIIHATRLFVLDRQIQREMENKSAPENEVTGKE